MFITVCANPVLDSVFCEHERQIHARHFFSRASMSAGGFGANAARALKSLGEPVIALMTAGGDTGLFLERLLAEDGVEFENIDFEKPARFASIQLGGNGPKMLVSPSPNISTTTISCLFSRALELSTPEDSLLIGGSVPPSIEEYYLHNIASLCHERPFCCCDVRANGVEIVLKAAPCIIRLPDEKIAEQRTAALRTAVDLGAKLALCSHGSEGLWAQTGESLFCLEIDRIRPMNPFGAGDCLIATLASATRNDIELVEALRLAVASAAASLLTPVPGHFEPTTAEQLLPGVRARRVS